jgi:hypothetical protein
MVPCISIFLKFTIDDVDMIGSDRSSQSDMNFIAMRSDRGQLNEKNLNSYSNRGVGTSKTSAVSSYIVITTVFDFD